MIDKAESIAAFPETEDAKLIRLKLAEDIPFELQHRNIPETFKKWMLTVLDSCAANVLEWLMENVQTYPLNNPASYYLQKIIRQCDTILTQIASINNMLAEIKGENHVN